MLIVMETMTGVYILLLMVTLTLAENEISRSNFLSNALRNYSHLQPQFDFNRATIVEVALDVLDFDSVNEVDYTISVVIHLKWKDPRLNFSNQLNVSSLELDVKMMESVWVPDLYVVNEKNSHFHNIPIPNKMMHLFPDGTIVYKLRVSTTASCVMRLQKYPFDEQLCPLIISSFSHTNSSVVFQWSVKGVNRNHKITLPHFQIIDTRLQNCVSVIDNTFTCIEVKFHLKRLISSFILLVYIPSTLVVIISWISFWLDCNATTARTQLGILTVFTMTTQRTSAGISLPKVSYVIAIDIWYFLCLSFVFASVIEFAFVNVLTRRSLKNTRTRNTQRDTSEECTLENQIGTKSARKIQGLKNAKQIDKVSRVIFPLLFMVCFVFYCIFVLTL